MSQPSRQFRFHVRFIFMLMLLSIFGGFLPPATSTLAAIPVPATASSESSPE